MSPITPELECDETQNLVEEVQMCSNVRLNWTKHRSWISDTPHDLKQHALNA